MDYQKALPHKLDHGKAPSQDQNKISRNLGVSRNTIRIVLRPQQRSGYQRSRNKFWTIISRFKKAVHRKFFYNAATIKAQGRKL
jgi:DNA-binding FadR family transcriptional regulator